MPIDPFQFQDPPDYTPPHCSTCAQPLEAGVSDALVVIQEQLDDLFELVERLADALRCPDAVSST